MSKIEEDVKAKLLLRGFSLKTMLNNRGIISAVVEETTEVINKNSICQNVRHRYSRKPIIPLHKCPICGNVEYEQICRWCGNETKIFEGALF